MFFYYLARREVYTVERVAAENSKVKRNCGKDRADDIVCINSL